MGGLGGTMNDEIERMGAEKSFECTPVANVQVVVCEVFRNAAQALEIPGGVALFTEEYGSHVVVDAVDPMSLPIKMFHGFGPN
jgi:hypothetical protein